MTQLFLVNKLATHLDVKNGYLNILPGGYAKIRESDQTEPTIEYAIDRGWAEITDKEPKGAAAVVAVEIDTTPAFTGLTAEELKAEQEKDAAVKAEKEATEVAEKAAAKTTKGKKAD